MKHSLHGHLRSAMKTEKMQSFGPYTQEKVSLPGKSILGTRPVGKFDVVMVGQTKSGKVVRKENSVDVALWTPVKTEEGLRFSVIFEFDESKAITIYEKYLTDVVAPKIPIGATVIVHGVYRYYWRGSP